MALRKECDPCGRLTQNHSSDKDICYCKLCAADQEVPPVVQSQPKKPLPAKLSLDSRYRKSHLRRSDVDMLTEVFGFSDPSEFLDFLDRQEAIQNEVAERIRSEVAQRNKRRA